MALCGRNLALITTNQQRDAEVQGEIQRERETVGADTWSSNGMSHHDIGGVHELGNVDTGQVGAVLDDRRALTEQCGRDDAESLRQNDVAHRAKEAKTLALRRLELPGGHGVQARAHDLGHDGAREQREREREDEVWMSCTVKSMNQIPPAGWAHRQEYHLHRHQGLSIGL